MPDEHPEPTHDAATAALEETSDGGVTEGASRGRWTLLPSSRRLRALAVLALVLALAGGGAFAWLNSGRAILGTHSGEGVLSFLPTWLPDDEVKAA